MARTQRPETGNRLLTRLPCAEYGAIRGDLHRARLRAGEILAELGTKPRGVYFFEGGAVSLFAVLENGQTVETATIGREGIVGLGAVWGDRPSSLRAVVQIGGEALHIDADRFHAHVQRLPQLHALVFRYAMYLLTVSAQSTACRSFHPVKQRFARSLLTMSDHTGSDDLRITQGLLSEMLGVRRASITDAFGGLQRDGLLARRSRGTLRILDRRGLEDATCECYRADQQARAWLGS